MPTGMNAERDARRAGLGQRLTVTACGRCDAREASVLAGVGKNDLHVVLHSLDEQDVRRTHGTRRSQGLARGKPPLV